MIGLLQRVTDASVSVGGEIRAQIAGGLLVLIGVERADDAARADRLLDRLLGYRVFADAQGRMNRSLTEVDGGLLLVPQFTLAADTRQGMRPGLSTAAAPDAARQLFEHLVRRARQRHRQVETGPFGADMQVSLVNDGPVTFWLQA